MPNFELMKNLHIPGTTKIVQLVLDGLGGLPRELDGKTELEAANTPNLDALAARPQLGLAVPVQPGDHSTPSALKSHSWHPVPTLLWSHYCRPDDPTGTDGAGFGERACGRGSLGVFHATDELPLALGHGLRMTKYGA